MRYLKKNSTDTIKTLIASGDEETSGRFIAVMADQSGNYRGIHLIITMGVFLIISFGSMLLFGEIPSTQLFFSQMLFSVALFLFLSWSKFGVRVVPEVLRKAWCQRQARRHFVANNLGERDNEGMLFVYISAAEGYVTVLADNQVGSHVSEDVWGEVSARARALLDKGQVQQAITFVTKACMGVLIELFPRSKDNPKLRPTSRCIFVNEN